MAGDLLIEPQLDLGSQMKNFYGHGEVLVLGPGSPVGSGLTPQASASPGNIGNPADRFQYLSFNKP